MAIKSRRLRGAASALRRKGLGIFDTGHSTANAAVLVSVAVVCFALFVQVPFNTIDPQRCSALVRRGAWPPYVRPPVDPSAEEEPLGLLKRTGREPPPVRLFDKWEPAGCRMHEYSRDNVRDCLGGQRVLFAGDATARVLYFAAMTRLDHEEAEWIMRETFSDADPRHDLSANVETVQLDFLWDPWLNSSLFRSEVLRMRSPESSWSALPPQPALTVVVSNGLWAARHAGEAYFDVFRNATDFVASAMQDVVRPSAESSLFFAPMPVPLYGALQPDRAKTVTPERISRMGRYLEDLPYAVRSHVLTAYTDMMRGVPEAYEDTGLHPTAAVAERWIDIPLNARCNKKLASAELAYKTTCCLPYPRLGWIQWLVLCSLCAIVVMAVCLPLFRDRTLPAGVASAGLLSAACLYCYVADRSHLFVKSEKHYSGDQLFCLSACAAVVCLWSRKRLFKDLDKPSVQTSKEDNDVSDLALEESPPPVVDFLARHITDEWKGLLLAAHALLAYQDMTQSPAFVQWAGFGTDAYLFLSAFGHASYFLHSGDYSLCRVASVLVRVNMLPCLLGFLLDGLTSGTPQSVFRVYYFPRLVSFWFLVTVATLWTDRRDKPGKSSTQMLCRVGLSAVAVWTILHWPWKYGILETLCSVASAGLRGQQWDVASIRRVLQANWLAPYLGMVAAVLARRSAQLRDEEEEDGLPQGRPVPRAHAAALDRLLVAAVHSPKTAKLVQAAASVGSFVCLANYGYTAQTARPRDDGGVAVPSHPYLASAAVVGFAILRNGRLRWRTVYLAFPAALGVSALEVSVLMNHILLSGNGTGRLQLFPFLGGSLGSPLGLVMQGCGATSLAVVLLAVGWLVHRSTGTITAVLFGKADKEPDGTVAPTTQEKQHTKDRPADRWRAASVAGARRISQRDVQLRVVVILVSVWIGNLFY